MLNSVHGEVPKLKRWCGPSAISIITGQPYFHALELLKDAEKRPHQTSEPILKGASPRLVRTVLQDLGYRTTQRVIPAGITVAAWLAARKGGDHFTTFLIVAANHWMVVKGEEACCGILGAPAPVGRMKFRRGIVTHCWVVEPIAGRQQPIATKPRRKAPSVRTGWERQDAKDRRSFVKLAKQHGLTFKIVKDCGTIRYLEIDPCPVFPRGLETMHHDWDETLDRVQHCLDHPEEAAQGSYGR